MSPPGVTLGSDAQHAAVPGRWPVIASIALRVRFRSTCSIRMRSASTGGRSGGYVHLQRHVALARLQVDQGADAVDDVPDRHRSRARFALP